MMVSKLYFLGLVLAAPVAAQSASAAELAENHAPVTLWLAPQLGSSGLSSETLKTNFALSLGGSAYGELQGLDLGVGASWVTRSMQGAQVTAAFNYAAEASGAQVSAGASWTDGRMHGVQLSGGFNYAAEVSGAQLSLVNVAGDVGGVQLGLVNVAGSAGGTQVGLLNFASESDTPIGLLSFVENGRQHVALWSSDHAPVNAGVKLGGRTLYSLLAVGAETSGGKKRWLAGFGLGAHVSLAERFWLDTELLASHVNEDEGWTDEANVLASLRVLFGYEVHGRLSLFAGPTLNVFAAEAGVGESMGMIHGVTLSAEGAETAVRLWPGLVAGFQL